MATSVTLKKFLEMRDWFQSGDEQNDRHGFTDSFIDLLGYRNEVYMDWVDCERLWGDSFEQTWNSFVWNKAIPEETFNKMREFFKAAECMSSKEAYLKFLEEIVDGSSYKEWINPLKPIDEEHSFSIEPGCEDIYLNRIISNGWKLATKEKTPKEVKSIVLRWLFYKTTAGYLGITLSGDSIIIR